VASPALLAFFDDQTTLSFLDTLLARPLLSAIENIDGLTKAVLDATLSRASTLSSSAQFRTIWTSHFITLHRLSIKGNMDAAGRVLSRGAQALLPFVVSTSTTDGAPTLPFDGFRHGSSDLAWREHTVAWTTELLGEKSLGRDQSQVLATLIYRSPETRSQFVAWTNRRGKVIDGAEAALKALLEVGDAQGTTVNIPESIALHFTQRLLADTSLGTPSSADTLRVVQLMCAKSPSTTAAVDALVVDHLPSIQRDAFTPSVLRLVSDLASVSPVLAETLNLYVNDSFAGLVRRFAEDEEDTEAVLLLIKELRECLVLFGVVDSKLSSSFGRRTHCDEAYIVGVQKSSPRPSHHRCHHEASRSSGTDDARCSSLSRSSVEGVLPLIA
jgi:hypothetical protein